MPMKAGITDNGKATADTNVARQLAQEQHHQYREQAAFNQKPQRRVVFLFDRCYEVKRLGEFKVWISKLTSSSNFECPRRLRLRSRLCCVKLRIRPPTCHSENAAERCSAMVFDGGDLIETNTPSVVQCDLNCSDFFSQPTFANTRMDCSAPPKSVRPPPASVCTCRNWRDTSAALTLSDCMRAASSCPESADLRRQHASPHRRRAPTAVCALVCCRRTTIALRRPCAGGDGVREHRATGDVYLRNNRIAQITRQIAAHT